MIRAETEAVTQEQTILKKSSWQANALVKNVLEKNAIVENI